MAKSQVSTAPTVARGTRPITTRPPQTKGANAPSTNMRQKANGSGDAAPSGVDTRKSSGGGPQGANATVKPISSVVRTTGHHTAQPGLTPTTMPGGTTGPYYSPSAKDMKAPGKVKGVGNGGSVAPSVATGPMRQSGPSGKG